ncbi:carboxylesterase/lipase family protein [Glycomyces harbinensis]|uniref:Carboxylic ester hydrolase n=1 Tax=Glycomyces harbinensis TaxID=58114 RepID=A0A1G7ADM2_9ACTN|nr:carboxylesterase family protein [Glycomyces harbinensis]SDE12567.1 para-nitrobenzyl esterase [Glycomyces harbinensis]
MTRSTARKALAAALAAAVALLAVGSPAYARDPALVETGDGWLHGTVGDRTRTFEGIPYAAPPVGDLRWAATEPAASWEGVREAVEPGAACAQEGRRDGEPVHGSEDCLFLNVHTPLETDGPAPVMVFLHGGGLNTGEGAMYDPTRIVERSGVIVVTVNYRLGALGFLAHPDLTDPYAGNFGLADQQAALRWVGDNIGAFGGDPGNVTLWGQSAGGRSTCAQLAAPGAEGLFHKAIVQSAPCGNAVLTRSEAERRGGDHAAALGCGDAADTEACLRDADLADLVALGANEPSPVVRRAADQPWSPVAGTEALPLQPLTAMRLGLAADVPLIHGGTSDEMRSFVYSGYDARQNPVTAESYPGVVANLFGDRAAAAIIDRYPADYSVTPSITLATLLTDYGAMLGTCSQPPALDATRRGAPVYAYEFAEPAPDVAGFPIGAHHSADLPYLLEADHGFGTPAPPTGDRKVLADAMIDRWTAFAASGDPGWDPYRDGEALAMSIDGTGMVDVADGHHCGFWKRFR